MQGRPVLPTYQSAEETFDWLVKHLDDLGVVAELDAIALQMISDAWEDYCASRAVIKRLGPTYATTTSQGDEMHRPRPELAMMNGAEKGVQRFIDADLKSCKQIYVHPLVNDRTLGIKPTDLMAFFDNLKVQPTWLDFN